jgi:glycosyltransferase involved in cell wall biosynthesis
MRPGVTIAVPSFNQGRYLDDALRSIFAQTGIDPEVFVLDGGSTDETLDVIERWRPRLAGARSHPDAGQAAAINEGIARGSAEYVCWLNSDDLYLDDGLATLAQALGDRPDAPVAYGRCWNVHEPDGRRSPVRVEPFDVERLALRCFLAQPATLIRRTAWTAAGGLDTRLHMAMDYDLWWRLYARGGAFAFVDRFVAVNRVHGATKTETRRRAHYREAIDVVRRHHGRVPLKWWIAQPYAVWYRGLLGMLRRPR